MSRLEVIDSGNWRDLLAAPAAVLVLGRSDCAACGMWTEELESCLAADENDTGNFIGVGSCIQLHICSADRVSDQDVRRL